MSSESVCQVASSWLEVGSYTPVDGRTTMSSESVCQVASSWVEVGSFHARLFGSVHVTCDEAAARRRLH
jgi:hypothetical protein